MLIRGFNDGEIGRAADFAKKKGASQADRVHASRGRCLSEDAFISGEEILRMLLDGDAWKAEKRGSELGPQSTTRTRGQAIP